MVQFLCWLFIFVNGRRCGVFFAAGNYSGSLNPIWLDGVALVHGGKHCTMRWVSELVGSKCLTIAEQFFRLRERRRQSGLDLLSDQHVLGCM